MDVFLTDSNFDAVSLIDNAESIIWNEKYNEYSTFEMSVPWSEALVKDLKKRRYLIHAESTRIMMVENADLERPSTNRTENLVKLSGRSLEAFLLYRNARTTGNTDPIERTGRRSVISNSIVNEWCVDPATTAAVNILPGLIVSGGVSGPVETDLLIDRGTIYDMVKTVLDADKIGFRIKKHLVNNIHIPGQVRYETFRGFDRTANPNTVSNVFGPDIENLIDISTFESIEPYYNHARMIGSKTGIDVFAPGTPSNISGYDRRTIVIELPEVGEDSTTTVAEDRIELTKKGLAALNSEYCYQQLVDGEVPPNHPSFINVEEGDIVWVRDANGVQSKKRITEKIWTSDSTGDKRFPTFEPV